MAERFFTRQQLLRHGVSPRELRPGGRFQRVLRGVYVCEDKITFHTLLDAALHRAPDDAIVSHHTAAALWGGVVPNSSTIHLSVRPDTILRMAGITAHRVNESQHVMLNRRRVTTPAQTFIDLAGVLELIDLVVLGDTLVRKGRVHVNELRAAADAATGRGVARARTAAGLVREGSESVQETKTRLLVVLAGLPELVSQYRVRDENGAIRARPDLAYPQWKVAIDYDGRTHFDSTRDRQKDTIRREWLIQHGWQCVTIYADDLFKDPAGILERIIAAIRANGGSVRVTGSTWQRHFHVTR
ncbi:uncharacterized protein DUF559 [Branchiibius hedensis]|uniref:DUF559 domain-containing protein n=1 Tax=Branchiibius hedensis TaxID=672460 RepID=A0A2Y8ZLF8_9MICO|nr:DUF559 domain-containing protein [Branchiibius hedensis]PWJ24454.1 uncharacterized protein DUF559 [Branchiibius hedensis]SSA33271.1 Protein of unknown function [Branchiibius hedensis]